MKTIDKLMNLGLTERQINNFINSQLKFYDTSKRIEKLNKRYLGQNYSPVVLNTPEKLIEFIEHSSGTAKNIIRRVRRAQREEEQNVEVYGFTKPIYQSVKGIVSEVREHFSDYKQVSKIVASKITPNQLKYLDALVKTIHDYIERMKNGQIDPFRAQLTIDSHRKTIYDTISQILED